MFGERKGAHAISRAVRWQRGSVDTASGVGVGAFLPAAVARELDSSSHWDDIGWLRKHSTPQSIRVAAPTIRKIDQGGADQGRRGKNCTPLP